MDNNYFDFLEQNSVAGDNNSNAGSNSDKGKVNLTVRVDADCQVVCDGDFLFLANANQIVKDKAPMGQHIFTFTSLDFPDATVERIVDFPVEGNNYLIVVNELKEKVDELQKKKETEKLAKQQAEEERKRTEEEERLSKEKEKLQLLDLDKAMAFYKEEDFLSALNLFERYLDCLNKEQLNTYNECKKKQKEKEKIEYEKTHDTVFSVNGVSFKMIFVEGGTFLMGDDDVISEDDLSNPIHEVTLSDFHIGETPVTQALWKAVMGSNPLESGKYTKNNEYVLGSNKPMINVKWNDCQEFIERLNQKTGRTFCLPTEAQWEYAARGGNKSKGYIYSGSNNPDRVAWYGSPYIMSLEGANSNGKLHEVKRLNSNELGVYDMSGNVDEWCHDWVGEYDTTPQTDPTGPNTGEKHVLRGGNYYEGGPISCHVAFRKDFSLVQGLRLALIYK